QGFLETVARGSAEPVRDGSGGFPRGLRPGAGDGAGRRHGKLQRTIAKGCRSAIGTIAGDVLVWCRGMIPETFRSPATAFVLSRRPSHGLFLRTKTGQDSPLSHEHASDRKWPVGKSARKTIGRRPAASRR